eukprot:scaffold199_cov138-Isochrysis_galbana.AAC.3
MSPMSTYSSTAAARQAAVQSSPAVMKEHSTMAGRCLAMAPSASSGSTWHESRPPTAASREGVCRDERRRELARCVEEGCQVTRPGAHLHQPRRRSSRSTDRRRIPVLRQGRVVGLPAPQIACQRLDRLARRHKREVEVAPDEPSKGRGPAAEHEGVGGWAPLRDGLQNEQKLPQADPGQ